ncbi:AsnC family transcriptional regulator [Nocardioides zeicaulis]
MLDPTALGFTFEAVVFVSMRHGDTDTVAAFEAALGEVPEVRDAHRLFGDPDYVLNVVARDLAAFTQLYDEQLAALPGVDRLRSTPVMRTVVADRPLPPFVGL